VNIKKLSEHDRRSSDITIINAEGPDEWETKGNGKERRLSK